MNIRPATASDFPAVLALNEGSVQFLSPLTRSRLAEIHREAAMHVVVEHDGNVAAFLVALREHAAYDSINYQWFEQRYERYLYVDRIVVGQALQGQGTGSLLYKLVFQAARQAAVPFVTCEFDIDPPNPISEKFHRRFGFQEVGRQAVAGGMKMVSLQLARVDGEIGA